MDKGAKVTGLLVFVAGVAMLIGVFMVALNMLHESRTMQIANLARDLPKEGFVLLARVLFLFVLGYVASSVAARGIQLFEAGPHDGDRTVVERTVTERPMERTVETTRPPRES